MKPLHRKFTFLTRRRIGALVLLGMIMGVVMASMGWAAPAKPAKTSTLKKKPPIQKVAKKPVMKVVPFKEYAETQGSYQMRKPDSWAVTARENKMIMQSAGWEGGYGVFGILHRPEEISIEQAISKELMDQNRRGVKKMDARVAGMRAIKLVGQSPLNPNEKMVEYYVENFDGQKYYIMLKAPRDHWNRYSTTFNTMLNSLSFN